MYAGIGVVLGFVILVVLLVLGFKFILDSAKTKILTSGASNVGKRDASLVKKFYEVDIDKYSGLLVNLGLIISIAACLVAFEWKTYDESALMDLGSLENTEEAIELPPVTEQPPPPPPQIVIQTPTIIEVEDDKKIEQDVKVEFTEASEDNVVVEQPKVVVQEEEPVKEEVEEIFTVVEETAEPDGGMEAFYKYLKNELKYPKQARKMNVEGKVFVQFIVDKDGSLTDVKVMKGIGAGCDEEAIRVMQEAKKWKPGKQRGRAVKQKIVVPIVFKLG